MKITELYFTRDEAQMIELHDGKGDTGGIAFIGETLDDFLTEQEQWGNDGYSLNAAEINKALKQCGIKALSINVGFKSIAGMLFSVNGQFFVRKGYYDNSCFYKATKFNLKQPIYLAENSDNIADAFTGQDFIDLCKGDIHKAKILFNSLSWEHPETRLNESEHE